MGRLAIILPLLVVLTACGQPQADKTALDDLDNSLIAMNDASPANDPALRSALRDKIMVDPGLVQQANADAIRPPAQPESLAIPPDDIALRKGPAEHDTLRAAPAAIGDCPQCAAARRALTLGALAQAQGSRADCAANVAYSAVWANRLPAGTPLYPDARVIEAAGADRAGCSLRIVSFASAAPVQRLLDWYYTKATDAGYRAQHKADRAEHVIAGTRPNGAFMAIVRPRDGGGSEVDLMADAAN